MSSNNNNNNNSQRKLGNGYSLALKINVLPQHHQQQQQQQQTKKTSKASNNHHNADVDDDNNSNISKSSNDDKIHLTLVYFQNVKRGHEQDFVKSVAAEYFSSNNNNNMTSVDIEIARGVVDPEKPRSVLVKGKIVEIIKDLGNVFSGFENFAPDLKQVPHIDLRGIDVDLLQLKNVSVVNNWYI